MIPRISPTLQMHDPIALPTANPGSPLLPAITETINSGVVVARLTSVEPMTTRGIRNNSAIRTLAPTNQSPPLMISARPRIRINTSTSIASHFAIFPPLFKTLRLPQIRT